MNFLGNLGININLLVAQIINFGLLLWLLSKFLYKPIVDKIEKDELELKRAQTQGNDLEKQKQSFLMEKNKGLNDTEKRAKEIIEEAEGIAKQIKDTSTEETEKEKQKVMKQIQSRLTEIENGEKNKKQK